MALRYTLYNEKKEIEQHFNAPFDKPEIYEPSYNLQTQTLHPVVRVDHTGARVIKHYIWGLEQIETGQKVYNVFKEKLQDNAYFKGLLQHKRCIIPASGFYEWKTLENSREPFYLKMLDKELIGIAGLYDDFEADGQKKYAYAMLTVPSNAMVKPLHSEMPAILEKESYDFWLNRELTNIETLANRLKPVVIYEMAALRVPELVNDPENDGQALIQPIPK